MKKFIALLCTLCMIATMVPFAVMAEDTTVTVYKSWDGSVAPVLADNGFEITPKTMVDLQFPTDGMGGNSGPYMKFTAVSSAANANEALIYSNGTHNYTAPYAAFSISVYGKALQDMYSRFTGNVKPAITGLITGNLVADRWNNVFVAWDGAAQEATVYVNGTEIRTNNFYDFIEGLGTASDTDTTETTVNRENNTWTWTNGTTSENGTFTSALKDVRFRFVKNSTDALTHYIDDIYVITSDSALTPAAYATVTSDDAVISGNSIVTKVNAYNATLSAPGAKIMVNHDDAWSETATVTAGDEVAVVTSTAYGDIYSYYTVTADTVDKFYDGTINNGTGTVNDRGYQFSNAVTSQTTALGGKVDDAYNVKTVAASGEDVLYTGGKNTFSTRYCTMSFNIYGKGISQIFSRIGFTKTDGVNNIKPNMVVQTSVSNALIDDQWNNVFMVYDNQTKDCTGYVNGELVSLVNLYDALAASKSGSHNLVSNINREAGTFTYTTTAGNAVNNIPVSISDTRIRFNNGVTTYFDDYATMYTDYAPTPAKYVADITGATIKGDYIIIDGASADISGSTVYVNNAATTTLNVDDKAVIVTNTPYGNIYKTYTVINNTISLATMDTMSFIQGGYPWIADENGTVANEDGVMGKNIAPTGAGNNVLITEAGNIFGSKYTMKELTIGYNSKNSTQTYYQASWVKADVEKYADYLVLEANFAFPNSEHATAISLSTDKGTGIGTRITFGATNDARVNHYMWIYDIQAGTYVDYLNGAALVDEPVAVDATFADGTKKTALRFGFSGTTKMADETYGTYEGGLKGYMADLEVYGAVNRPAVKTAPSLTGAVGNCYPIYDISEFTLDSIKALAPDADNVYVYTNRSFSTELVNSDDKAGFFYMIITEKDDIYGYYRVCRLPNADATYAIETISPNATGVSVNILNLSEGQDIAAILAEYNGDDFVKCNLAVQEDVAYGNTFGIKITDVADGNNVTLFGWNNLNDIKPLGDAVVVK